MGVFGRGLTALLLSAVVTVGHAQGKALPKIEEFYFDGDVAAQPFQLVSADAADAVDQLMKMRERGRKTVDATSQLASIAIAQGRPELGEKLHQEAIAATLASTTQGRAVRWNHAWDLYRRGEGQAALAAWSEVHASTRGNPGWAPPTYALGLWVQGRKDEAVRWYAAAVRTEPQLWNDPGNFARLLPHWRQQDRDILAEVYTAWNERPPSWP
jgi:tetratricopeptide (TPR) repeat protein